MEKIRWMRGHRTEDGAYPHPPSHTASSPHIITPQHPLIFPVNTSVNYQNIQTKTKNISIKIEHKFKKYKQKYTNQS